MFRRSSALLLSVGFFVGVGTCGAALRARAREAAVGANRPEEGVFGRGVVVAGALELREGVLGRALGVEGALGADFAAMACLAAAEADLTDCPVCCGLRGCEEVLREDEILVAVGGDLNGDLTGVLERAGVVAGVLGAGILTGAVGDREGAVVVGFDTTGVGPRLACLGVEGDFGAVGLVLGSAETDMDEGVGSFAEAAGGESGLLLLLRVGEEDAATDRDQEDDGIIGAGLSFWPADFGGHSRFSFTSSLAESPVVWDVTLAVRGAAAAAEDGWRFVCSSKRPMRLATLPRERSSGSGLQDASMRPE